MVRVAQPALSTAAHSAGLSSPVWIITPINEDGRSQRLRDMNRAETCWGALCRLGSVHSVKIYTRRAS